MDVAYSLQKFHYTSAQGVEVPNLIKFDSVVAALRMREKHDIAWVFGRPFVQDLSSS